jgi:hypothetical protein
MAERERRDAMVTTQGRIYEGGEQREALAFASSSFVGRERTRKRKEEKGRGDNLDSCVLSPLQRVNPRQLIASCPYGASYLLFDSAAGSLTCSLAVSLPSSSTSSSFLASSPPSPPPWPQTTGAQPSSTMRARTQPSSLQTSTSPTTITCSSLPRPSPFLTKFPALSQNSRPSLPL